MLTRGPFPADETKEGDGLKLMAQLSRTNGDATRKKHLLRNFITRVQRNHVHEDVYFLNIKLCKKLSPGIYELHVRAMSDPIVFRKRDRHHSLTSHLKLNPCCGSEEEILSGDCLAATWVGEAIRLKERH